MMDIPSRYRPRYVRSLVYMLQQSEYRVREYLAWVHRTSDFAQVEKRKQLDRTTKALALLALTWAMFIVWCFFVIRFVGSTGSDVPLVVGALVIVMTPFILPYAILIPLFVVQAAQWPAEAYLVGRARRRLRKHKATKIAIAGSYGKTSTREVLKTVLSEGKKVAAPGGSYNTPLGIAKFVSLLSGDEDVLVFEFGEYYPGDIRKLCEVVRPDIGVITGINEAHLEKFGTLERTADTIFELAAFVEPTRLYLNGDNERVAKRWQSGNIAYSRKGSGSWQVTDAKTGLSGTSFTLGNGISTFRVRSQLLGLHLVGPLAVAVDIALSLGLTVAQIESGIARTKPFAHRLEPKNWVDGVTFLDDSYNGNPDGAAAAIGFLATLKGRRFYVTPGLVEAGQRARDIHEKIGRQLAEAGIEKVALIRTSVAPYIEAGLKEAGFKGDILKYPDMPTCLAALHSLTVPGDIVLVQNDWPDQYA